MDKKIISLCYVNNIRDKTVFLNRVADFHEDHFEEYLSVSNSGIDSDRDFIVGYTTRLNAELGSFGVYEWYAFEDGDRWKTDVSPAAIPWTEVLYSSYSSPQEIISAIKNGWRSSAGLEQHNVIIVCRSAFRFAADYMEGVYLPAGLLKYDGNTYSFPDNTYQVETGRLYADNLLQSRSHNILLSHNSWKATGHESVWSINEILDSVIGNLINKLDKDALSRKERQAARAALSKLSSDSIEKAVAERVGCSEEEAHEYVSDYLKTRQIKLEDDQISSFVRILIEGDAEAVQEMRRQVEDEWRQENAEEIASAEQDILAAREVLQGIIHEQESAKSDLALLNQEKINAESQVEEVKQLQSDIKAETVKVLENIRTNNAAALVDAAFLDAAFARHTESAGVSGTQTAETGCTGYTIHMQDSGLDIQKDSVEENFAVAVESVEQYCAPEAGPQELMLFLFAAYACRQHLVITGETAENLALMYSASVTGVRCPIVNIEESADIPALALELGKMPHSIVAVREFSATCYERLRELMRLMPDVQFLRLLDHEESLLMEPNSFYTTFFPVLTDLFCQSAVTDIRDGFDCSKELMSGLAAIPLRELNTEKAKWHKWFGTGPHSLLLERRCAQLQIVMERLARNTGNPDEAAAGAGVTYLYAPLMKCLRKTESLAERLRLDSSITVATKDLIKSYCSIEDE